MKRSPLRWLALWIFVASALSSQLHAQQSPPAVSTYPNNSEGLRELLDNMLVVAKKGDKEQLQSVIRELEIPNYEIWFTKNFGQEKGESWAEPYGRRLTTNEDQFEDLMMKLAHMDGEFIVEKMDTAKRYDLLNGPLDGYIASWKVPAAPKGKELVTLADFFFIEGKFRWDSTDQYFPFQPPSKHSFVPAKVVKKVQPEYPAEARQNNIQGAVKIQVIIQKDGSVTVQNVVEGDPILSPAAIEAVKQWHYEPTLFDGKPVDVQTTIEVNFTLKP
jgi:TonB family protein